NDGLQAQEKKLQRRFSEWWTSQLDAIRSLPGSTKLMQLRARLIETFTEKLKSIHLLGPFQVAGVIASWWTEMQYEFRTVAAVGFDGLIDGWVATIRDAAEGDDEDGVQKADPFEHKLIRKLLPEYLEELEAQETEVARIKAEMVAFEQGGDDGDE